MCWEVWLCACRGFNQPPPTALYQIMSNTVNLGNSGGFSFVTIYENKATFTPQLKVTWIQFVCSNVTLILTMWTAQVALNLTFPNPIQATFKCGTESDTYRIVLNATAIWTVRLHLLWLWHYSGATHITVLRRRQKRSSLFIFFLFFLLFNITRSQICRLPSHTVFNIRP